MHAFKLKHPVPDLQPIGSVSLLGATPTAGDPQVAGAMIYGEPQDAFTCGLFSSTEGSFTMTYPFT
ncbi:cytoplasmic protein, partial [Escherichia coli]|nr:cytoplasmic protein [Escherichia coli]